MLQSGEKTHNDDRQPCSPGQCLDARKAVSEIRVILCKYPDDRQTGPGYRCRSVVENGFENHGGHCESKKHRNRKPQANQDIPPLQHLHTPNHLIALPVQWRLYGVCLREYAVPTGLLYIDISKAGRCTCFGSPASSRHASRRLVVHQAAELLTVTQCMPSFQPKSGQPRGVAP